VVLDIDGTDDETHGSQQLSMFHGFYDQHMFHPVIVFDGESGHLIRLVAPGNAHASRGATTMLERTHPRDQTAPSRSRDRRAR